jgi:hypothetical protein
MKPRPKTDAKDAAAVGKSHGANGEADKEQEAERKDALGALQLRNRSHKICRARHMRGEGIAKCNRDRDAGRPLEDQHSEGLEPLQRGHCKLENSVDDKKRKD